MISILFNGWFQARFATDPDPFDHPRGNKGWTFAVTGEPDFDRIIRFSAPVAPRSRGPLVSVSVSEVRSGGQPILGHPLVGAAVNVLDAPKFEGHNGDIAPDGHEPVFPLHLQIAQGSLVFETSEWLALGDLKKPKGLLRQGKGATQDIDSTTLGRLLGGLTPPQYRSKRRADLMDDLATATSPADREAIQERIRGIADSPAADGIKMGIIPYRVRYSTKIPLECRHFGDPEHRFNLGDPMQMSWMCSWWMGAWDADALCGYVEGSLDLS